MASSISESIAPTKGRRALALFTVLTAQFMLSMDLLIVVVALPRIQEDLGFNPASLTWVLNAFGLPFGGLLLLGGRSHCLGVGAGWQPLIIGGLSR